MRHRHRVTAVFMLVFAALWLHLAPNAFADENFAISLNSVYSVNTNGNTSVQEKFQITNKKPTVYAKEYALEIGATKIENIKALDGTGGQIPFQTKITNNKTTITLVFSDTLVGADKSRNFTIQFDNPDTATITGNVLEVDVPRLANVQDYVSYTVALHTPLYFGSPARITPKTFVQTQDANSIVLTFNNLHGESISALFGQKQIFDYSLRYLLQNPTGNNGVMQIALPPDTAYQKMIYRTLDPMPQDLTRDADGNWIATYEIAAQNNVEVDLVGKAYMYLEPQTDVPVPGNIPEDIQPQPYWESSQPQIRDLAQKLRTPKAIYDYVVAHLSYNYAKVNGTTDRLGALTVLSRPQDAVCQEFTDLFIAIARAAGIPARRNTGFAYTANSKLRPLSLVDDVLHAWPEYYDADKKAWIQIDPTWGNTTGGINYFDQFDFNHLVFAINGSSSSTPYAAGAYKQDNENTKTVNVKFGKEEPVPNVQLNLALADQPTFTWHWPLQASYMLSITNKTGSAFYQLPLNLTSDPDNIHLDFPATIDYLLPFQTRQIPLTITQPNPWQDQAFHLTVTVGGISSSYDRHSGINPQTLQPFLPEIGVGGGLVLFAIITWRVLVPRRKR